LTSRLFEFVSSKESGLMSSIGHELSWISNLLVAGWQRNGEPIGPESGARGTKALVELGLQSLVNYDSDKQHLQIDPHSFFGVADVFELGWQSLYRRVSLPCARALDKRLQDRNIQNSLVREAWFGACKRRKMDNYGMEYWVRQGRYQLVRNVLNELEYALGAEATYYARTLLDDLPRFPEAKPTGAFKPRTRYFVKVSDFEKALSLFRSVLEL
jgi:hypothetical protein